MTFDDLPATSAGIVANDLATLNELTRKLLNAVRKHRVPAFEADVIRGEAVKCLRFSKRSRAG